MRFMLFSLRRLFNYDFVQRNLWDVLINIRETVKNIYTTYRRHVLNFSPGKRLQCVYCITTSRVPLVLPAQRSYNSSMTIKKMNIR